MNLNSYLLSEIITYLTYKDQLHFIKSSNVVYDIYKNKKELSINVVDSTIQYILQYYRNIEILKININKGDFEIIKTVFKCIYPRLKMVVFVVDYAGAMVYYLNTPYIYPTIQLEYYLSNLTFKQFIKNHSQLEYIHIENSYSLTDSSIECILSNCKELKELKLIGCKGINREYPNTCIIQV